MPATYSSNLRFTRQGTDDNPETWGQIVNEQLIDLVDEAIAGVATVNVTGSSDIDLSVVIQNGATDVPRHAVLEVTGTIGANIKLILPSVEKVYIVRGNFTGSYTVTLIPAGASSGITLNPGDIIQIYTVGVKIYKVGESAVTLKAANNLSDLTDAEAARNNLGLGDSATLDAGDGPNELVQRDAYGNIPYTLGLMPTGVIMPFAGTVAPSGYLLCYGQAVSRTMYAALFGVISTTFGSGDGATTFNLPDLRGRVIAGKDNMGGVAAGVLTAPLDGTGLGNKGGAQTITLTPNQLPKHSHKMFTTGTGSNGAASADPDQPVQGGWVTSGSNYQQYIMIKGIGTQTVGNTGISGNDEGHNNIQPTIVLNYIIRA